LFGSVKISIKSIKYKRLTIVIIVNDMINDAPLSQASAEKLKIFFVERARVAFDKL